MHRFSAGGTRRPLSKKKSSRFPEKRWIFQCTQFKILNTSGLIGCIFVFSGWYTQQLKSITAIDNCLLFVWRLRNTWLITCLPDSPLEIRISEKSRKSSESEHLKTSSKRILNQKGLLFIYCALLKPQLWFCMHMSSSCARIYRCIFTSSHIICIMKIHPLVNRAQDLLHMLWFYSFLVLKLFTTSADHELSFSKIIRINHSSCSHWSFLFFDLLPIKWSAGVTFNIDAECMTEKICNLALTLLLFLSHMTQ